MTVLHSARKQVRDWRWLLAVPVCMCIAALGPGAQVVEAQCLNLVSQNALHFGQGAATKKGEKFAGLKSMIDKMTAGSTVPVLMLMQEVMYAKGTKKDEYNPFDSTKYGYVVSKPRGASSYLERYGFVTTNPPSTPYLFDYQDMKPAPPAVKLVRPPVAVLWNCPTDPPSPKDRYVWILSFHAVFGSSSSKALRLAEAKAMAQVIQDYMNCQVDLSVPSKCASSGGKKADYLIIGGDWNLDRDEVKDQIESGKGFFWGWKFDVLVPQATSLRTADKGKGEWSMSYDHFVVVRRSGSTPMSAAERISFFDYGVAKVSSCKNDVGCKEYREKISDHIGIHGVVKP